MAEPTIIPRDQHSLSRKQVDPDALKVLYRLRQHEYIAYLVGGSVRDLLLGRRPKDFDIGTSAHPYEVKRLFRNCWIIGRRFRLAHVKFGTKVIEVATFRRQTKPGEAQVGEETPEEAQAAAAAAAAGTGPIHRDNTFGTPEEDAFRRDFTINALFYDIATFAVIDYVGGLEDLRAGLVRCIGDPDERFTEDPVRMMRAVALAARLDFQIDLPILESIARQHQQIALSAPARLIEEYYKILRAGSSERAFRGLAAARLLEPIAPELHRGATTPLWESLARLDAYRQRFEETPPALTNSILLGSLLVPLGFAPHGGKLPTIAPGKPGALSLGLLPIARRDVERLSHILMLAPRLLDPGGSPRAHRALMNRSAFQDALTWIEIHEQAPDALGFWRGLQEGTAGAPDEEGGRRRRRRRRRRPRRPTGEPPA
ncbi:MAG: polynucleotide adenylyltransferase PcnB [Acidobacteriota bacterium]|nr:polynucleotide adenylyltransferase PcnB [Acidobacteriota bacterium]